MGGPAEGLGFAVAADHVTALVEGRVLVDGGDRRRRRRPPAPGQPAPARRAARLRLRRLGRRRRAAPRANRPSSAISMRWRSTPPQVDGYWQRFTTACAPRPRQSGDREWFGLGEGRVEYAGRDPNCPYWLNDRDFRGRLQPDVIRTEELDPLIGSMPPDAAAGQRTATDRVLATAASEVRDRRARLSVCRLADRSRHHAARRRARPRAHRRVRSGRSRHRLCQPSRDRRREDAALHLRRVCGEQRRGELLEHRRELGMVQHARLRDAHGAARPGLQRAIAAPYLQQDERARVGLHHCDESALSPAAESESLVATWVTGWWSRSTVPAAKPTRSSSRRCAESSIATKSGGRRTPTMPATADRRLLPGLPGRTWKSWTSAWGSSACTRRSRCRRRSTSGTCGEASRRSSGANAGYGPRATGHGYGLRVRATGRRTLPGRASIPDRALA